MNGRALGKHMGSVVMNWHKAWALRSDELRQFARSLPTTLTRPAAFFSLLFDRILLRTRVPIHSEVVRWQKTRSVAHGPHQMFAH
jgi:hypothetical protein